MSLDKLNVNLKKVKPSATLVINELSSKLIREGVEVFKFGFGQSPFPVPKNIVQALKENAHQKDYLPVKGLFQLRQEVAGFFYRNYNLQSNPDNIIIGPGSKELIFNFQMAYNIDELLLPSPSWVSYEPQATLNNHETVWLNTCEKNNWKIDPDDIINHCKTATNKNRVIILNYPSNPLGVTYSNNELQALSKVFKRYNIIVIADEIYGEVHFDGEHQTIATYYPEGTIISTGLSKWAGAGGWRLGVFVFPKNLRYILEAMAVIASETFTSTSAPIQYAAVEAYKENPETAVYLKNSRRLLKAIGNYVHKKLIDIGITMPKPEGGFYVYPNFDEWKDILNKKGIYTSTAFCNILLKETGVALLPGEAFGHPKEYLTTRLSFVDFNGELLLEVLKNDSNIQVDEQFVEHHCPRIIQAIKKIETWLMAK